MLTDRSRIARSLCSSLAIATALIVGSGMAQAQSFQGNGTFASGTGGITTAANTTTVNITSSDAVIDWTTFDTAIGGGPINFQPASTTATFQSVADFTVLNRIIPTDQSRAIQFNGNVIAQIQGTTPIPGGDVYFYSPGGIIVGSTAVFNVANLGLTSAAPQVVGGKFVQGSPPNEFINFTTANPGTAVTIQAGAQINSDNNSYLAVVAPVITNSGTITGERVAALVSADSAVMTLNMNGLFDIQVTSGTSGTGTTLFNNGSIAGPAGSAGLASRIYLVAVPKNTAITLAIGAGSTLGFAIAGAADVVGNAIVLSAGADISGGVISGGSAGAGTGTADVNIVNSALTSALQAQATTNAFAFSVGGGTSSFASDVTLRAFTAAKLSSDGTGSVTNVAGNLILNTQRGGQAGTTITDIAGTSEIFATNGGNVGVTGNASVLALGIGQAAAISGQLGGSGTGGIAIIQALTGGDVSIGGNAIVNALGQGGAGGSGGGQGGIGLGGRAQIFTRDSGSSVSITGTARALALGIGGTGNGASGGDGTGGLALVNAQTVAGAGINIGGAATLNAYGVGGNANGGNAGAGFGGAVTAAASAANNVSFAGSLDLFAGGQGGNSTGGNAGSATGGTARITLFSGGTMSVGGNVQVHGIALAGMGNPNSAIATGNVAAVSVQQNSVLNVTGSLQATTSGLGDRSFLGVPSKGAGIGGITTIDAFTNGAINVGGALRARADATATDGRNSTAGTATVAANSGGDITSSELNVTANGFGGTDTGTGAGFGTGGTASIFASGAGSTITVANGNSTGTASQGDLDFLSASGVGGVTNGGGSGVGGAATGGTANLSATAGAAISGPTNTGTQGFVRIIARAIGGDVGTGTAGGLATGGIINITVDAATLTSADLLPSSFAQGGSALATATGPINGGNATGGQRNITVRNGATLTSSFSGGGPGAIGGNATLSGRGGDASGGSANLTVDNATLALTGRGLVFSQNAAGAGGTTGNVTGGTAFAIVQSGGTISVPDVTGFPEDFFVGANAFGAPSNAAPGTAQGTVTAGTAALTVQGGTITGAGSIVVSAEANAASDQYAQGGTYQGGQASVFVRGGSISNPLVRISASANAANVGAGLTGTGGNATGGTAQLRAPAGSTSLTSLTIDANGQGGDVLGIGSGGTGTGGSALLIANGGAAQVSGTTSLASNGSGGDGGGGGSGGNGTAGAAIINTLNNVSAASSLALGTVVLNGDGFGGMGGAGLSGGGAGGVGGLAMGGNVQALGGAGNGTLTTGNLTTTATAFGGSGGAGGTGAAGGTGGNGLGGFIQVGTASFTDNSPTNTGSGTFGATSEDASAFGGSGGAGGSGTTQGAGGNGGAAFDGATIILVRGSPVTFTGAVTLDANAFGGNGGAGSTVGAGGNATVGTDPVVLNSGGIAVNVTERFQHPEQPGRLTAGSIIGRANAAGGTGSTLGASLLADMPIGFNLSRSTATIGTLDLSADANTPLAGAVPSFLTMFGSTATISNLSLDTIGTLSLGLDTSTLNTGNLTLRAFNFVLPATLPAAYGTINVSSGLTINSSLDFLAYANLNLAFNASLSAPGSVLVGDVTVAGTLVGASGAGGTFTAGNLSANTVTIQGTAGLTTAAITSPGVVTLRSNATITTGAIQAGTIDVSANSNIVVGTVQAGPLAKFRSFGVIQVGNVTASGSVEVLGAGGVNVGNVIAGSDVGIGSGGGPSTIGNITAQGLVSVSGGQTLSVGNIIGTDLLGYVGTGTATFGSIVTGTRNPATGTLVVGGRVLIENASQFALGGTIDNFNPSLVFAAQPVASVGAITINGPVSTGSFDATTQLALTTASVSATGAMKLEAGGAITTGQLTAGDTVEANAGGALNVAGATAGTVLVSTDPLAEYNVGLRSLTSVVVGNVAAKANFGVSSPGSIAVGNVSVGQAFLALPGTSLTTGSITTSLLPNSRVYIANFSMEALGGQIASTFDPAPIFAAAPVATGGPITINGPVSTIIIQANTLQSLTATGTIQTPGVTALIAGTTLNAANIAVGDRAIIAAGGNITLGNVDAGFTIPSNGLRKIAIGSSSGTVTTGNLASVFDLGIQAGAGISTGTLLGRQILLLAGSNVSTGAISAVVGTQPVGQLFVGNFSMASPSGNVFTNFASLTAAGFFNLDPVRTGGSITFGGNVQAGNVSAAAGQAFTASAITTGNYIRIDAGGLASINGAWRSPSIDVVSGDIAIASTGSLDGLSADGEILLASTNSAGMFVGDGLTPGNGYALSNDEFSRVRAGEIDVVGSDITNLATDLTIGNLTINASQLYGANGVALFASGNRDTQTPSGILRIAGAVVANGFTPTTEIDLLSGTVELEAVSGSLKVNAGTDSQSPSTGSQSLGGLIYIEADRFHAASDEILLKLRTDPKYTGHIAELNAPASVQRTDGILNALGIDFEVSDAILIQNTGSSIVPAGFVTTQDGTEVGGDTSPPQGGRELVLNGQFQTSTGLVTGKTAFDQAVAQARADATANGETFGAELDPLSTLNGCVILSGVCAFGGSTQMAPPASEISVIISPVLAASPPPPPVEDAGPGDSSASSSDSEAAVDDADSSEDEKKDEGDSDEAASPIAPPAPLISTRALDGDVNVVEPVSGAGNPALFGSAVNETTVQGGKP